MTDGASPPTSPRRSRSAKVAARLRTLLRHERTLWEAGCERVAGVDEAGVGPLAGPIVAAAVVFAPGAGLKGVDDSKKLTARRRDELAEEIRERALCYRVVAVDPAEIDQVNILQAGLLAMRRALDGLDPAPDHVLLDGRNALPGLRISQECVIAGDRTCHAIAAASILAKTERDARMRDLDAQFPGYGFADHKGYPTAAHRDAIRRLGPSPIHRRSFTLLPQPRLFD